MSRPPHRAPRGVLGPVLVGSVALALAAVLGFVTVRDTAPSDSSVRAAHTLEPSGTDGSGRVSAVATRRLVSRQGGFAVAAPRDLEATAQGATIRLTSPTKDLVVVVGPAGDGPMLAAENRVLAGLRQQYDALSVLGQEPVALDGRRGSTTYGQAVNDAGARLRFAVVVVHAGRRNYAVASYTARDADPATVLPRVNAVANGFEVLPAR